mgnify:CR=1 FL=1
MSRVIKVSVIKLATKMDGNKKLFYLYCLLFYLKFCLASSTAHSLKCLVITHMHKYGNVVKLAKHSASKSLFNMGAV